ncbi:unnamed protein product [Mytilus coruscus]|uniref:Tyr recombinase domain-containing protein n=1 Tax=Mytilus coruscus TaxID=42192 RepID=A0A6J8BRC0_MYTCO|nr:unnamed protein product [Mytilus coruscus]
MPIPLPKRQRERFPNRKQRISKRSQLSERVLPEQPFSTIFKVKELNYPEWENITSDLWILDTVRNGYKVEFDVVLQDEKIDKIISLGKIILQQKCVTERCFASFIGLVVHAFNAVSVGPLHNRNMERNKVETLNSCYGDFDSEIIITQESKLKFFEDFQNHLQMSSLDLGDLLQSSNTNILGENSLFGVFKGKPIPFDHLKRIPGFSLPNVVFKRFDKPELCVVKTMINYVLHTKDVRKTSSLFISYATFRKVSTSTLSRWLKTVLLLAGIDINIFKAHSFRGASTSAALTSGYSIKDIMATVNWTYAKTFYKFYYRECNNTGTKGFSSAVITG